MSTHDILGNVKVDLRYTPEQALELIQALDPKVKYISVTEYFPKMSDHYHHDFWAYTDKKAYHGEGSLEGLVEAVKKEVR